MYQDRIELYRSIRRCLQKRRYNKMHQHLEHLIEEHQSSDIEYWLKIFLSTSVFVLAKIKTMLMAQVLPNRDGKKMRIMLRKCQRRMLDYCNFLVHYFQIACPTYVSFKEEPINFHLKGIYDQPLEKIEQIKCQNMILQNSTMPVQADRFYQLYLNYVFTVLLYYSKANSYGNCNKILNIVSDIRKNLSMSRKHCLRLGLINNLEHSVRISIKTPHNRCFPYRQLQIVIDYCELGKKSYAKRYLNSIHNTIVLNIIEAEQQNKFNKAYQQAEIGLLLIDMYRYAPKKVQEFYNFAKKCIKQKVQQEAEICFIAHNVLKLYENTTIIEEETERVEAESPKYRQTKNSIKKQNESLNNTTITMNKNLMRHKMLSRMSTKKSISISGNEATKLNIEQKNLARTMKKSKQSLKIINRGMKEIQKIKYPVDQEFILFRHSRKNSENKPPTMIKKPTVSLPQDSYHEIMRNLKVQEKKKAQVHEQRIFSIQKFKSLSHNIIMNSINSSYKNL